MTDDLYIYDLCYGLANGCELDTTKSDKNNRISLFYFRQRSSYSYLNSNAFLFVDKTDIL